jgi:hypothetical protein
VSGAGSALVPISKVPIFEVSGHCAGPSLSKLASASRQAVWPSAASGLIVKPGGKVTLLDFSCEGELAMPRNCGASIWRSRPEGESVSLVVGLA